MGENACITRLFRLPEILLYIFDILTVIKKHQILFILYNYNINLIKLKDTYPVIYLLPLRSPCKMI